MELNFVLGTAAELIKVYPVIQLAFERGHVVRVLSTGKDHEVTILGVHTPKRVAKDIEKVLRSAIANAERKADDAGESLDVAHLFVSECFANEGSRWKRLRPAPMGRAFRYQKRTAHIMVGVAEHAVGVQQRAQAAAADEESNKGVRGAVRKARQAITGQQGKRRPAASNPSKPGPKKK